MAVQPMLRRPALTKRYPSTGMTVPTANGPAGKVDPPMQTGAGGGMVLRAPRPLMPPPPVLTSGAPGSPPAPGAPQMSVPQRQAMQGNAPAVGRASVSGGTASNSPAASPAASFAGGSPLMNLEGGQPLAGTVGAGVAEPGGVAPITVPPVGGVPSGATQVPGGIQPTIGPPGGGNANTNLNPLNDAMRRRTMEWLENPSPYDDELWNREVDRARTTYDENTAAGRDRLNADLARRGVDFGTIYRNDRNDFETDRARGFDDIMTGFLSDRARGIADARRQSFDAGSMERGYYDDLRNTARGNALQENVIGDERQREWLRMAMQALGVGSQQTGEASEGYGRTGTAAGSANSELMKWLVQMGLGGGGR